jgi:hypothetical protein
VRVDSHLVRGVLAFQERNQRGGIYRAAASSTERTVQCLFLPVRSLLTSTSRRRREEKEFMQTDGAAHHDNAATFA